MSPTPDPNLATFLDIATEIALSAGAKILSYGGKFAVEAKSRPDDLVTAADKGSEEIILKMLGRHFPDHGILAEESGKLGDQASKYTWAIDPIDGTTNFAHNYPLFAVSIGLLIEGIPQVGVVYNPALDQLFRAARGLGATCNRVPIQVSQTQELSKSILVTGFAYDRRETKDNNYAEFCHLTHLTQGVRRSGSASVDLASVASGSLDGYWERGLSPWDVAAGIIILEEAGGKITAYDRSPLVLSSGRILATNGVIHDQLSEALLTTPSLSSWDQV
jgi:myo-inositol-1(or 4)-monophosphatase